MNHAQERQRKIYFVAALPLLAFCVWAMCRAPLSSDDVWTLATCDQSWSGLLAALRADVHPPFYFLLAKPWLALFGSANGNGEAALQSFSACTFLAAVAFVWFLYPDDERYAAVLLLNPIGLLSSRLGRMYALLLLLCVVSVWAWREKRWALLALINCFGTLTHIWFFFFLLAQGATTLAFHRPVLVRYTLWNAASVLPYAIGWLPVLLGQLERSREAAAWLKVPSLGDLASTLLLHVLFSAPLLLWPKAWPGFEMLFFAAVTLLVPFALSFWKPVFYGRFTIPALLPLSLALARMARPPLAALTLLLATAYAAYVWQTPAVCTSAWTAQYLREHAQSGDVIIFTSLSRAPIRYYWRDMPESFTLPRQIDAHPGYEPDYARLATLPAEAQQAFASLASRRVPRVWLLTGFSPDVEKTLGTALEPHYTRDSEYSCPALECYFSHIRSYRLRPDR